MTTLTTEQTKRVQNAIIETTRIMNKELNISADLRRNDFIKDCATHLIKLANMISHN